MFYYIVDRLQRLQVPAWNFLPGDRVANMYHPRFEFLPACLSERLPVAARLEEIRPVCGDIVASSIDQSWLSDDSRAWRLTAAEMRASGGIDRAPDVSGTSGSGNCLEKGLLFRGSWVWKRRRVGPFLWNLMRRERKVYFAEGKFAEFVELLGTVIRSHHKVLLTKVSFFTFFGSF